MKVHEIIAEIRAKNHLTQDAFAERLFVTRQAVSRWENGESIPNVDTLKLIAEKFGISLTFSSAWSGMPSASVVPILFTILTSWAPTRTAPSASTTASIATRTANG